MFGGLGVSMSMLVKGTSTQSVLVLHKLMAGILVNGWQLIVVVQEINNMSSTMSDMFWKSGR